MYWFWSNIYTTLYQVNLKTMMTMYSLHSTPHSPCRHLLTTAAPQTSRWLSCWRCWLPSDWYRTGCHNEKKYPPITILPNICKYCPVPNNPMSVSLCDVLTVKAADVANTRKVTEAGHLWHRHSVSSPVSTLPALCISPSCPRYWCAALPVLGTGYPVAITRVAGPGFNF